MIKQNKKEMIHLILSNIKIHLMNSFNNKINKLLKDVLCYQSVSQRTYLIFQAQLIVCKNCRKPYFHLLKN